MYTIIDIFYGYPLTKELDKFCEDVLKMEPSEVGFEIRYCGYGNNTFGYFGIMIDNFNCFNQAKLISDELKDFYLNEQKYKDLLNEKLSKLDEKLLEKLKTETPNLYLFDYSS